MSRLYRATAATADHLFRKGEKIASRKKDRVAARALHDAVALLEGALPLDEDTAGRLLPPAEGAITSLVASGESQPEEQGRDQSPRGAGAAWQGDQGISGRLRKVSGEIASAQDALSSRPAFVRGRNLRSEKEGLEKRITLANGRLDLAKREIADLEGQAGILLGEVREKAESLSGKPVRVRDPDIS